MTDPTTLHAGGTGLGRDIHDAPTVEINKWEVCCDALKANAELRESIVALGAEVAGLHRRCQWLTLGLLVAFCVGFIACAVLMVFLLPWGGPTA